MVPEGWNDATLGDLVRLQRGHDLPAHSREEGEIEVIGGGGPNGFHNEAKATAPGIVIGRSGSGIGNAWWTEKPFWPLNTGMYVTDYLGNDPRFCFLWLDWIDFTSHNSGGAQPSLNRNFIYPIPIPLPPLAEQRKIADILSTWDRAIETTEALLVTARTQKRALMQTLLTGKRRFPEFEGQEWKEVRIGDIANEVSLRNKGDADHTVISCTKTIGFVNSLDYFKKQVFSDDLTGYKIIRRNQIGYPSNHIEEGSIGIQNLYDVALVSPIYTIFETGSDVDPMYLFRVLKTDRYRQMFAAATSASVDRRGSLRWKAFSTLKVILPPLAEQKKINDVLSVADAEIADHEAQMQKLRTEKKALMQQLLTGKRRVVV